VIRVVATASTVVCIALAQSPAFDVASVKPNRTGANGGSTERAGGRVSLKNTSLRECIEVAYSIPPGREYEMAGPAWLDSEKFDIVATAPPETSRERVREMLQTLLAERFHLQTHYESKKLKAYALVVGKRGPKLKASSGHEDGLTWGEGRVTARALSISQLADRLSGPIFKLERPVVDMTGIVGLYDFTLEWAPDGAPASPGASIFTALEDQLGLKLEVREIEAQILVVDRADKIPVGN
jgi:uncharacterized protein (TIGR03435 family)